MEQASRRMVQAAINDESAFKPIVDRHKSMVYSIGYNFFQDRAASEDLAQDVFFDLFRHLWSIESDAHLTNWLRQAMTRRCIDHARWRKTHAQQPLEEVHEPSDHRTPPDVLMQREVRRKLMALPDRKRMVVVLRFQEGLELDEIAEMMDMPVNTVKSTLHRALAVLKRKLAVLRNGVNYDAVRG